MLNNVNQQGAYIPQGMPQFGQPSSVNYLPPPPPQFPQQVSAGATPVYGSIPYVPMYGNYANYANPAPAGKGFDISTVKIELNGLEPPKVPGLNDFQPAPYATPVYPGATQIVPSSPFVPYPPLAQQIPQIPQYTGFVPLPAAIPPSAVAGAMTQQPPIAPIGLLPPPPQFTPYTPAVQTPPPSVINTPQPPIQQQPLPVTPANSGEEIAKPLIEALGIINSTAPLSIDQQSKAIEAIAGATRATDAADKMAILNPSDPSVAQAKADAEKFLKPNLIKEDTFLGLANIAMSDTSKMTGEDKQKADVNRVKSMWTLSMLQKMFKTESNEEYKKINLPPISMNEVPGIVQMINITQKDSNPEVREAGILALKNLADPQDPKDVATMKEILGDAQKDPAENVKLAAEEVLKMYTAQPTK